MAPPVSLQEGVPQACTPLSDQLPDPQATLQDKHNANELILHILRGPGSAASELSPGAGEFKLVLFKGRFSGVLWKWLRGLQN